MTTIRAMQEYQRKENIKKSREESANILAMMKGKWIGEDGSYFYISDEEYTGSYLLFYDGKRNEFTECPGISFKWLSEDENRIDHTLFLSQDMVYLVKGIR